MMPNWTDRLSLADLVWLKDILASAKAKRRRWVGETRSKYMPHQGERECARRRRKAAAGAV